MTNKRLVIAQRLLSVIPGWQLRAVFDFGERGKGFQTTRRGLLTTVHIQEVHPPNSYSEPPSVSILLAF